MTAEPTSLRYDTVTLLSDLGTADGFVGVVHSVVRQMAPGVALVDLTHEIAPFDVRAGSLVLARSIQFLCPGVIVGLVDPSVGTGQRPVAIEVAGGAAVLLGPDNGLLAPAVSMVGGADRAFVLDRPDFQLPTVSTTMPGRDIFAAVAARLCTGVTLEEVGTEISTSSLMPGLVPLTSVEDDASGRPVLSAEVMWVDRFGNVQLNVDPDEIEEWGDTLEIAVGGVARSARRVSAFGRLTTGQLGLLVDGDGLIAVVSDRSSAAEELGLGPGDAITISPLPDDVGSTAVGIPAIRTSVQIGPTRNVGGTP